MDDEMNILPLQDVVFTGKHFCRAVGNLLQKMRDAGRVGHLVSGSGINAHADGAKLPEPGFRGHFEAVGQSCDLGVGHRGGRLWRPRVSGCWCVGERLGEGVLNWIDILGRRTGVRALSLPAVHHFTFPRTHTEWSGHGRGRNVCGHNTFGG